MIILNIGDELTYGQVVNTNASFMCAQFTAAGFPVEEVVVIGDNAAAIVDAVAAAFQKTDILVISGGLGPTKDDITKQQICHYFDVPLVENAEVLCQIEALLANRGVAMSEINRLQAQIPQGAIAMPNYLGTAPGLWLEQHNKLLIALPGVPFEMKALLIEEVLPRLKARFLHDGHNEHIVHKVIQTTGIPESTLSDKLESWEMALPPTIALAYLPRPGIVRLRLTGQSCDLAQLEADMNCQIEKLTQLLGEHIFSYENNQIEEVVAALLLRKEPATLACAESCTGGYLSHLITSVPGSSRYFKGSIVSYSNEIKRNILNVRELNLKKHGAVSEYTVNDMAINTLGLFETDYSIAVSGIAGPDGGTPEKPVGTVWIAVATPTRIVTREFHFGDFGRDRVIQSSAIAALNMLRLELLRDL
ncbi:MAG: competence/damage-inducible protein A [Bacteroidales bacterium]|nr:competence/damage-inducible protein A [Bacteroidales bacterium]